MALYVVTKQNGDIVATVERPRCLRDLVAYCLRNFLALDVIEHDGPPSAAHHRPRMHAMERQP